MKSAKELGITKTQRRNLARLAVRFRDLKRNGYKGKFYMGNYCQPDIESNNILYHPGDSIKKFEECGTCGCLLGHAPYLGIGLSCISQMPQCYDGTTKWESFSEVVFGLSPGDWGKSGWEWLFDSAWKSSKPHALKRIAWVLENGFPNQSEFSLYDNEGPSGFNKFVPNWEEIEKAAK